MGDLKEKSFDDLWQSPQAAAVRERAARCQRNCWMVGRVRPAMRSNPWVSCCGLPGTS